jgi:hypothetical protein
MEGSKHQAAAEDLLVRAREAKDAGNPATAELLLQQALVHAVLSSPAVVEVPPRKEQTSDWAMVIIGVSAMALLGWIFWLMFR